MLAWVKERNLDEMIAAVSEGFCSRCSGRLVQEHPFDLDDPDPIDGMFAQGGCPTCSHWLRAGHDGSDGRDWFSVILAHPEEGGAILTLTLNPPADPDDEDEDWE